MDISGIQAIKALTYCTRLRCSSVNRFLASLELYFSSIPSKLSDIETAFRQVMSSLDFSEPMGQREALNSLLERDLEDMQKVLPELRDSIDDPVAQIDTHFSVYKNMLGQWGIDLASVNVRVVDEFPEPYREFDAWAMNFDVCDEQEFGIPVGVAFHRKHLLPIVSSALLAHELIHCVFSTKYSYHLARGLEEGLCEVLGLVLSSHVLGNDVSQNILINFRLSEPSDRKWRIYTEATRQAILLYRLYGLQGLKDILRAGHQQGRVAIKEIERELVRGHYTVLDSSSCGEFDPKLDDFLSFFAGYPQSLVVSPLAYCVAEKINVGDSVREVIGSRGFRSRQALRAIQELQDRVFLVLTHEGNIASDETKVFLETKTLRYDARPIGRARKSSQTS